MSIHLLVLGTLVTGAGARVGDVAYIVTVDVSPEPILSYPKNTQWQEVFNPTWCVVIQPMRITNMLERYADTAIAQHCASAGALSRLPF